MKKNIYNKIAAFIAIAFSMLTLVEGLQVLLGITHPDYYVLRPLLIYNVVMGFVGFIVGITLWLNYRRGLILTSAVTAAHVIVFLIVGLIFLSNGDVAGHSINAMIIRSTVWMVVLLVVWRTNYVNKKHSIEK